MIFRIADIAASREPERREVLHGELGAPHVVDGDGARAGHDVDARHDRHAAGEVRERGADGFREALAEAMPLSELLVRGLSERVDLETSEGRARLLFEARSLLHPLAAAGLRLQLVHRIAELARITPPEVDAYFAAGEPVASRAPRGEPIHGGSAHWAASHRGLAAESASGADPAGHGSHRQATFNDRSVYAGPSHAGSANAGGQPGRRADWRSQRAPGAVPRAPVAKPDLEGRVRLLLALHPALAAGIDLGDWLSPDLTEWIAAVERLPAGSTVRNVIESLGDGLSTAQRRLERELASDAAALAELSHAEAGEELSAALDQLRDRYIRREMGALASSGLRSDEDRARYQALVAMRKGA
ncbi:MAG: hypothetical protein ACLGHY_07300 [Gammaproteobacteria bacterium]